jgi:hypothetical protein
MLFEMTRFFLVLFSLLDLGKIVLFMLMNIPPFVSLGFLIIPLFILLLLSSYRSVLNLMDSNFVDAICLGSYVYCLRIVIFLSFE